jgi:plasmid stabilization system protein ParE
MSVKIRFTRRGRQRANEADAGWQQHHPQAPDLFLDEFQKALGLLAENPGLGAVYEMDPTQKNVRRFLMQQTGYYLYYRYTPGRSYISLLSVWSARRGAGPKL